MSEERPTADGSRSAAGGNRARRFAAPGRGGLLRILRSAENSLRGIREGLRTEAAIRQEAVLAVAAVPLAFLLAGNVWVWVALVASMLLVLAVEFLNTALERLCNHITPERHEAIRVTKDLASAAVFFALCLAGLVWLAAILLRLGIVPG